MKSRSLDHLLMQPVDQIFSFSYVRNKAYFEGILVHKISNTNNIKYNIFNEYD